MRRFERCASFTIRGYRFPCSFKGIVPCRHAFHPLCAYLHGLEMEVVSEDLSQACASEVFAQVEVRILCVLHCTKSLEQLVQQTYYR